MDVYCVTGLDHVAFCSMIAMSNDSTGEEGEHPSHSPSILPLVSIVIPAFNAERTLPLTLASIHRQHYMNWELLITDDGSSDATLEVIDEWKRNVSNPVSVFRTPQMGPSSARNHAATRARGPLLAFLDADDIWDDKKLLHQVRGMQRLPNKLGITCAYAIVDGLGKKANRQVDFRWDKVSVRRWLLFEGRGPALCSTLLVKSKYFRMIGGFDDKLRNLEDVDLALRLGAPLTLTSLSESLCQYTVFPGQNHKDLASVRSATQYLVSTPLFGGDPNLARRLQVNLSFLESIRQLRKRPSTRACFQALRSWMRAPFRLMWLALRILWVNR